MKIQISIYIILCFGLTGCEHQFSNKSDRKELVESVNTFSVDLYKKMVSEMPAEKMPNTIISPLGASVVLGMLYQGAGPSTAQEMETALGWGSLKEKVHPAFHDLLSDLKQQSDVQLYLGGQVWYDNHYELVPAYTEAVKKHYGTVPEGLAFSQDSRAAGERIGRWIEEVSHHQIKSGKVNLSDTGLANLLLSSVVYFKGQWVYQFNPKATEEDDFFVSEDTKIKAKMMSRISSFKINLDRTCWVLEMPYKSKSMSMVILLPFNFSEFENGLTWGTIQQLIGKLKENKRVGVRMPKFEFRNSVDLGPSVKALGLKSPFMASGGFPGMTAGANDFQINKLSQETYIKVNEEGTEAYAVTKSWSFAIGGEHTVLFNINRPFMFLIRDFDSGLVLFVGKVTNPNP